MRRTILGLALLSMASGPLLAQTSEPVGIPECDRFLASFDRCISVDGPAFIAGRSMTEEEREEHQAQLNEVRDLQRSMRDVLRQWARDPANRAEAVRICAELPEEAARDLGQFNCRF
jgi:hypothetical protein